MASLAAKYADLLSTREQKASVFGFFHPETKFQKSVFMHLQALHLQDPCGRSAKTMQNMCISKWMTTKPFSFSYEI